MIPSRNAGTEAELYALYARFAEANPGLAYVYMSSTDGGYVQWPEGNIGAEYDPRERPFYPAALRQPGEVVRTEADYFASDDATIISSVRTVEDDRGQVIGVQGVDVSLAAGEQSDGVGQVNQAVSELDRMTQQNTQLVEASRTAAYRLTEQAEMLAQRVGGFVPRETAVTSAHDERTGSRLPAPADAQHRSGGAATVQSSRQSASSSH